jgi:hypothetical protein
LMSSTWMEITIVFKRGFLPISCFKFHLLPCLGVCKNGSAALHGLD